MISQATAAARRFDEWIEHGLRWILSGKRALWGVSATRILVGVAVLGILLSNFTSRHVLWGPGSFWVEPLRATSEFASLFGIFDGDSTTWFTFKYLLLTVITVAFTLGWRARLMNVLLLIGLTTLIERTSLLSNQGDNIIRIGLLLMVFMKTAEFWSLDARRNGIKTARQSSFMPRKNSVWLDKIPTAQPWFSNLLHNAALIALALQVFILYTASALFKAQGSRWQDGTAVFYPLQLPEYTVFPWLSSLVTASPVLTNVVTYIAVFAQMFIVVALLHPVSRRLALMAVIGMHAGIAVLMGLPWFSLAMIAFDAIFISSRTYGRIDAGLKSLWTWAYQRVGRKEPDTAKTHKTSEQSTQKASVS